MRHAARRHSLLVLALVILLSACGGSSAPAPAALVLSWTETGALNVARWAPAVLLQDGRVLIVGGDLGAAPAGVDSSSAEVYEPATATWDFTGTMAVERRYGHTATMLADGRVLVVGGGFDAAAYGTAEIYDPTTGLFTPTGGLNEPRYVHSAILLEDGRVFVTGGRDAADDATTTAEVYDPATGLFTTTGESPSVPRSGLPVVTLLPGNRVLITMGAVTAADRAVVEVYDVTTDEFDLLAPLPSTFVNEGKGTSLADGRVFLNKGVALLDAWVYDPVLDQWDPTGPVGASRGAHGQCRLSDGTVLLCAGTDVGGVRRDSTERFDPSTNQFVSLPTMNQSRYSHSVFQLHSGAVLAVGGFDEFNVRLASCELLSAN